MNGPLHGILRLIGSRWLLLLVAVMMGGGILPSKAMALELFNLDSIAAMGKFPRFCVNTYYWGDKFFNGYDTVYVNPTGYKFNIKVKANSWLESNTFRFDHNDYQMDMVSYPSTSAGVWLTYMAVSVGYDVNVSKLLALSRSSRKRFNAQFNCMLFAADFYIQNSNSRMKIRDFGPVHDMQSVDEPFNRISNSSWGLDTYYFFNHKHYSQSAAFSYSRIQRRSSGSLFAGLSFSGQTLNFDFSELPDYMRDKIASTLPDYRFHVHAHNYAFKLGYGYNWVLSRKCVIGISEAPSIGIRHGYVNDPDGKHNSLYGFNRFGFSFIFNNDHWFAGLIGQVDTNLFTGGNHSLLANNISFEASVGYRFNLW